MTAHESWWPHRDYVRVAGRARSLATRRRRPTLDEINYLRATCMLLLTGPLPLPDDEARDLRELLTILDGLGRRFDQDRAA